MRYPAPSNANQDTPADERDREPRWELASVGGLALLAAVVQLPFIERGISLYDEGSILAIADGLNQGKVLYRDLGTQLPPLTYELMAWLLGTFGRHLLVGRLFQMLVFILCTLLFYGILRAWLGQRAALLGSLAMLPVKTVGFPQTAIPNYSHVVLAFALFSLWALVRFMTSRRLGWLACAGVTAGLAIVTKQNIGILAAGVVALGVTLDVFGNSRGGVRAWLARGLFASAAVALPVAVVLLAYTRRGALADLLERAVLGVDVAFLAHYVIPFPLSFRSMSQGFAIFTYYPPALLLLSIAHKLDFARTWWISTAGIVMRAVFVIPIVLLAGGFVAQVIRFRTVPRQRWNVQTVVLAFAGLAYVSILYRPDLAHLTNVAPAWLLGCAVALSPPAREGTWLSRLASGLWVSWLLIGALAGLCAVAAYDTPLDTSKGRLLGSKTEVTRIVPILRYLGTLPDQSRPLFLRTTPMYYFLADRQVPIPFDLVMPGLIGPGDDERIAGELPRIDRVLVNPTSIASVPSPISEYAPLTSQTLRDRFRIAWIVSPSAYLLMQKPKPTNATTVLDLFDQMNDLRVTAEGEDRRPPQGWLKREDWLIYQVIGVFTADARATTCFRVSHLVGPNEAIIAQPLLNPEPWLLGHTGRFRGAVFEIRIAEGGGEEVLRRSVDMAPPLFTNETVVQLGELAGREIEIEFCVRGPLEPRPWGGRPMLGWGNPRVVRWR